MSQDDGKIDRSDVKIDEKVEPDLTREKNESDENNMPNVKDERYVDVLPQNGHDDSCGCGQKSMGTPTRSFIYAIGRIEPRFPSLGIEKEYHQVLGKVETKGKLESERLLKAISPREYRYLARKMCWVLKVEGIETYLLTPSDPADLEALIETIRIPPRSTDIDVVIGVRGPVATPDICNGLLIPIVVFDQIYSFDLKTLTQSIPKPPKPPKPDPEKFVLDSEDLFNRIVQLADNVGSTDEHRALNYLSVRYDGIYQKASELNEKEFSLSAVEVRPSRLSGTRKIVDVIFSFRNVKTDFNEMHFVRVDVTEEFPFLVSKMSPYYPR